MATTKIIVEGQKPDGEYQALQLDSVGNLKTTGGSGGGGGSDVRISDGTDTVSITDVSGKKSLDVNVTDININHSNDSVRIGDGTSLATTTTETGKTGLDVNLISAPKSLDETVLLDEADPNEVFVGYASPGTSTATAAWKIKKITTSGTNTLIKYAGGSASYSNIWANRAGLTYT